MKRLLVLFAFVSLLASGCAPTQSPSAIPPAQQKPTDGAALDLSNRSLTAIPSDVFTRSALERLDLSNNRLSGAPQAEIRHLQKLKYLDLSGNNLTGLPAELGQLKNLETLNVANNKLTGLPLELGNLTQLRVFDISGNAYSKQDLDQISAKLPNTEIRR